jgi:hypothetical protein
MRWWCALCPLLYDAQCFWSVLLMTLLQFTACDEAVRRCEALSALTAGAGARVCAIWRIADAISLQVCCVLSIDVWVRRRAAQQQQAACRALPCACTRSSTTRDVALRYQAIATHPLVSQQAVLRMPVRTRQRAAQ